MKFPLSMFFVLLLALSSFSQPEQKEKYDSQKYLFNNSRIYWLVKDKEHCDEILVDGNSYRTITINNLKVAFLMGNFNGYMMFNFYVKNNSDQRIDVRPEDATIETWKKLADLEQMYPTIAAPVDPKSIAQSMANRQAWANALSSLSASMATQNSTVTNNQTGQTATITSPNNQAQINAQNKSRNDTNATNNLADSVINTSFKANTLFPGNSTAGNIFFKAKKHETGSFVFKINGIQYVFTYRNVK